MKRTAISAPAITFPSAGLSSAGKIHSERTILLGFVGTGDRGTTNTINCLNSAPNVELRIWWTSGTYGLCFG